MEDAGIAPDAARVLVLGFAFKENCADVRNTKVADLAAALRAHCAGVDVYDPRVGAADRAAHGLIEAPPKAAYDALMLAVAHREFQRLGATGVRAFGKPGSGGKRGNALFDVKRVLPAAAVDGRL